MFTLALLIGIYSYTLFLIGLLGLFYRETIVLISIVFLLITLFFVGNKVNIHEFKNKIAFFVKRTSKLGLIFLSFLLLQLIVNLVGALGPELGFDALWYHLTIPKIYLNMHEIVHIPGSLLYYSTMPKFAEMLYVPGLVFGNEILAKLIHFSFGILTLVALYKVSLKFLDKNLSILVLVLFYSNLVVGWMSITSYVDLARTFFEIMVLWAFLEWIDKKNSKWLIESAVMLGLAISTKLLALGSLLIFVLLIIIFIRKITKMLAYCLISLLIPLPWFVFSFVHTGNPVYPFFTDIYQVNFNFNLINPLTLSDPISPLYVIFLPVAVFLYGKFKPALKIISLYSFFAIVIWYLTPQTGGGRFILPYLPALSIVTVAVINMIKKENIQKIFIGVIIFFAVFSILYRGGANLKNIPVILGQESKTNFLSNNLNFSFGDFYDTDGYFAKKIKKDDEALLYGFHNLYYANFPFIDSSYVKKGDMFNYIAVQGNNLPKRFKLWNMIYYNEKTDVRLYSVGGLKWVY